MFLLLDKPKGITSHDLVDMVREITGERRVGHSGTLDPNATGLVILGVGRNSTKKLTEFLKMDKVYQAEITLGEEKDTDDITGKTIFKANLLKKIGRKRVEKTLQEFVGKHIQIPPEYSAIKIQGKKSYEFARSGINISLPSRKIEVYYIKLLSYKFPVLRIEVKVSSGTYIRSLARDLGRKLGTYGFLSDLRRIKIGNYEVDNACKVGELTKQNWKSHAINL